MAQFSLKMNGADVCTLDELKANFNPAELISYRSRFAAWLRGWDYDDEAAAVKALDQNLSDEDWLNAVCKIIGISEQELEASRKKLKEAAKQAAKKAAAQQKEAQKRKDEQEQKKKLAPTPKNIRVDICSQKSPFCDAVSSVFSCEKGVLVNTKSDHLYFSADGEKFVSFNVNSQSRHYYSNFTYLGGYWFFLDYDTIYFSKNGEDWDSFELKSVIPKTAQEYGSSDYRGCLFNFENITYDDYKKSFVIFYHTFEDIHGTDDSAHFYYCATAKYPDCAWTDWGNIGLQFLEPTGFHFINGKYFAGVTWGMEKYGYNGKTDNGVYYSKDGLHWQQADASDREWLDGLDLEIGSRWIHIDYCECKDGQMRYFMKEDSIDPWRKNYFGYRDNIITVWQEGYERQDVSEECEFPIKTTACINDKLLIFGDDNEFALGEIRVK